MYPLQTELKLAHRIRTVRVLFFFDKVFYVRHIQVLGQAHDRLVKATHTFTKPQWTPQSHTHACIVAVYS